MSLKETIAEGDLREQLEALRDTLASELDDGSTCKACGGSISSPTPALAKQLRDVLTQLAGLKAPKESKTDDLKGRREQKLKRAAGLG